MTLLGKRYDESAVLAVPKVEETETWKPIHHSELITSMNIAVESVGMQVRNKSYALARDGQRMFGLWEVGSFDSSMAYMIGIRNSLDKSLAIGVTAGTKVFVCDNLAFSGDLVTFRRHTKNVTVDLDDMCRDAVLSVIFKLNTFAKWHKKLKAYTLRRKQAELLTLEAMRYDVINQSQFKKFYSLFFDERAKYGYTADLYSWHEAVTELNREKNLFSNFERSDGLNRICNSYIARYGQPI